MKLGWGIALSCALATAVSPALAESASDQSELLNAESTTGVKKHDGFYLRMQLGGGYTNTSTTIGTDTFAVRGGAASLGIALGGAVAPNVILYGTLIGTSAPNPEVAVNDTVLGTGAGESSLDFGALGAGLAYYFERSNVFLAGSLLLSQLTIDDPNGVTIGESDVGFTFEGLVGKEWWVSDEWGLGISGQLLLGAMRDREPVSPTDDPPTWGMASLAALFSATYN